MEIKLIAFVIIGIFVIKNRLPSSTLLLVTLNVMSFSGKYCIECYN